MFTANVGHDVNVYSCMLSNFSHDCCCIAHTAVTAAGGLAGLVIAVERNLELAG